ncbi:MAG: hypothetical protein M1839_004652 [Geoglossum umbratile]|nr:MAG: hypothetical protein M1839_004652 [Geoglossum umbratile]
MRLDSKVPGIEGGSFMLQTGHANGCRKQILSADVNLSWYKVSPDSVNTHFTLINVVPESPHTIWLIVQKAATTYSRLSRATRRFSFGTAACVTLVCIGSSSNANSANSRFAVRAPTEHLSHGGFEEAVFDKVEEEGEVNGI